MIGVILFVSVVSAVLASPFQSMALQDDGSYQFFYETGADAGNQMRSESRGPDGVVTGRYEYKDPTGEQRVVNYRADDFGYVAKGDVGVAGAPEGQFPAQPDDVDQSWTDETEEEHYDTHDTTKTDDVPESTVKKQDTEKDTSKEDNDEQPSDDGDEVEEDGDGDEDDVKPVKLPEPSDDAPPEGFPVGFFTHQFHNIRRLPDPSFGALIEEYREAVSNSKTAKPEKGSKGHSGTANVKPTVPVAVHHQPHHFGSYPYHGWEAVPFGYTPGVHHPVQSYAYSHPMGHGYYYFY